MSSFRILNQAPQYLLADGTVNAGGKLYFYETDLTTPKNTWSDEAMTTLNSNPVVMDAAGRTLTDVWGLGEYGVKMTDSADVVIWTRNNVQQSGDAGATIPALQDGEFLTNDGSNLLWQPILQVPDPTGHSGQVLYSDGSISYWAALPATPDPPDPDIVVGSNSFRAGITSDNTKFFLQEGNASMPASGTTGTLGSVVFPTPYDTLWGVFIQVTGSGVTAGGHLAIVSISSQSASGFSAIANVNVLTSGGGSNIITPVTYHWLAVGTVEVAP